VKTHITSDPWGPRARARGLLALIVIGIILLVIWACTDTAGAAPLAGNQGGCGKGNQWYRVPCTVTDAGVGFVSGTCDYGLWFKDVPTRRTFWPDELVTVRACEFMGGELAAPISISRSR
jgi:hypothetical protein